MEVCIGALRRGLQADISRQEEVFSYCFMTVCGLPKAEVIHCRGRVLFLFHCVSLYTVGCVATIVGCIPH